MKKIITNFLLFIFCSVPRLIKAQKGIDKLNITKEERAPHIKFPDDISFAPPSNDRAILPVSNITSSAGNKETTANFLSAEKIERFSIQQVKYAMMMDVAVETIKNTTLYRFIETWYGTRYRYGGTTKRGIDCSAFTDRLISAVYSLVLPRTAREQYKECEHITKDDLLEGDLVFLTPAGAYPTWAYTLPMDALFTRHQAAE